MRPLQFCGQLLALHLQLVLSERISFYISGSKIVVSLAVQWLPVQTTIIKKSYLLLREKKRGHNKQFSAFFSQSVFLEINLRLDININLKLGGINLSVFHTN